MDSEGGRICGDQEAIERTTARQVDHAPPTPVVIVTRVPLLAQGMRLMFKDGGAFRLTGECRDAVETMVTLARLRAALVVLDAGLPGDAALEIATMVRAQHPACGIVLLTEHEAPERHRQVGAHVDYCVPKSAGFATLQSTLHRARRRPGGHGEIAGWPALETACAG